MAAGSPSADAVRAQLTRILASEIFSRSDRLTAFLTYIVEQTLDGHGAALKEHVLAMEVYGKGADFGAAVDPIVRVDARRLRDKLREYYASAPHDPVVISVPKGSYAPIFQVSEAIAAPALEAPHVIRPRGWTLVAAVVIIAALTWIVVAGWRARSEPPTSRLLTVTSFPGGEGMPSLSPDGNFVVYAGRGPDPNETNDLWVKAVDGDALRRLTDTPQLHESMPAWSPDGRQIAFYNTENGTTIGVFVVSSLGGPVRQVASRGIDPAWTPDGRSLLFASNREGEDRGVFVQLLETGALRQLTRPPVGFRDSYPKVSPDGKTLAFGRSPGPEKKTALFVMPMSGGDPVRLTDDVGVGRFDWTPSGREVLFPQLDTSGLRVFRIVASPGHRATAVPNIPIGVNMLSVSPIRTGQTFRVALGWGQSDVGLRLIDLQAVTPTGMFATETPFCDATRIDMPGRISRDGRHVAFASDRNGDPQIWVADRDGSGLRSVSGLADGFENAGSWSPDGRFVAVNGVAHGNTDIYVVSVEGGSSRRLTESPSIDSDPEWSVDGRWIYYTSNASGRSEIWKMPATGGTPVRLTSGGGFEPRESSDGRVIYYVDASARNGLGVAAVLKQVSAAGGPETVVFEGVPPGAWDVTDRGIVFVKGAAGVSGSAAAPDELDFYSFADRRIQRLGGLPFQVARYGVSRTLTVSRDGRWALAAHIDRWDRDILVVDNFR
jgi:Tol biopolymer transport system component